MMEYLENGKVKRNSFISLKTYLPYFGIENVSEYEIFWNMEYFEIWNIL